MDNQRILRILRYILAGITLVYFFIALLKWIEDPDFFWHLATGKWIVENLSLPAQDPFSYTTPALLSSKEYFTLTSYWLSQILYYGIYYVSGWNGFIILRFIILGAIIYFVYKRAKDSDKAILFSVMAISLIVFVQIYPLERPQVFSFLFFAILLYLLEDMMSREQAVGSNGKRQLHTTACWLLPVVMLFWANMHGGYIIGLVVILVYLISEGIRFLHPSLKPMGRAAYQRFLIVGISGIIASLINPNTYKAITEMWSISGPKYIVEYASTITLFKIFSAHYIPVYWLLLLIASVSLLYRIIKKRFDIQDIIMLIGLGYFSFTQFRYIAFFLIWAAPFIALSLTISAKGEGGDKVTPLHPPSVASRIDLSKVGKEEGYLKYICILLSIFIIVVLLNSQKGFDSVKNITNFKTGQWLNSYYPEEAVDFIKENDIKGNMFNYFDWGGYLIWRFYPEKKVFIDGRNLYEFQYSQWGNIMNAIIEPKVMGKSCYKALLDSYKVRYMLIPLFMTGGMPPIVSEVIKDKEWFPVFLSNNSMVFIKDTTENHDLIKRYAIPKDIFVVYLFNMLDNMIENFPGNSRFYYLAKGDLYLSQNRFKEAWREYEKVLKINPANPNAQKKLEFLKKLKM